MVGEFIVRTTVRSRGSALLVAVSFGLGLGWAIAYAEGAAQQRLDFVSRLKDRPAGEHYFVDFRARRGAFFGHAYIVYGHLGAQGQVLELAYAGNYPPRWDALVLGSVIPVPTVIGSQPRDVNDPATIVYRRKLTAVEFARVKATVRHLRATEQYWHLMLFNCNDLLGETAKQIGLHSPLPWLPPHAFVAALGAMNSR